jgi:ABC-type transport system involved in cytochrome c biogenesis ATPase subunit
MKTYGAGKSTLLRIIVGLETLRHRPGPHRRQRDRGGRNMSQA